MSLSFALALGGGGARGLAHVAVFEALDQLGQKPVAIAGSSMGALLGAAYAAGMPGREIRRFILALVHDRAEVFRRLIASRAGASAKLFNVGFGVPPLDAEKFCQQFLPSAVPDDFGMLAVPLIVVASDLNRRREVAFSAGPLKPALAASIAVPTLMRPVVIEDTILIDGAATNPLPFDRLRRHADVVVAVDLSGAAAPERRDVPNAWDSLLAMLSIMGGAITAEKVRHDPPDLMVQPKVGAFRALDFLQASAILRAAHPVKAELKEKLSALIEGHLQGGA
jgi:NTE family protein